jgi:hypothetical protein
MPDIVDISAQNAAVTGWANTTLQQVKNRYMQLVHGDKCSGDGLDSLKMRTYQHYGEIDGIGFKFDRYLIFVHKGANKGHGGAKGSTWTDAHGVLKRTNPLSLGKMNTGNSLEKPWLNPVMDDQVPKLADIVADFKAELALKQVQIK